MNSRQRLFAEKAQRRAADREELGQQAKRYQADGAQETATQVIALTLLQIAEILDERLHLNE